MMSHKLPILIISGKKEDTESAAILAMSRLEEAIKGLGTQRSWPAGLAMI